MSNEYSIIVEGLSKKYTIGKTLDPTLRGTVSNFLAKNQTSDFWALDDISFNIPKGEAVGIIGRNGAGKSTLLKLLSKITYPTRGKATLYGNVSSLLEVGTGFHPELTGRENIYLNGSLLGMTRSEINSKLDSIIDFSGVSQFIDTPVKRYSSGMYVRLAFSVATHLNSEILILDEVLAVGDASFQKMCLQKMNDIVKDGRTILLVSHEKSLIQSLTKRSILLEEGKIAAIESSQTIYEKYHNTGSLASFKSFANAPLKNISVYYREKLQIEIEFDIDKSIHIPHISIAVTDHHGQVILGNNPKYEKLEIPIKYRKGKCIFQLESPVIRYGTYFLSIWIADGSQDIFNAKECVSFSAVTGSSKEKHLGYLIPDFKIMDGKQL